LKADSKEITPATAPVVLNFAITRMPSTRSGANVLPKKAAQRYGFCPSWQKFSFVFYVRPLKFSLLKKKKKAFQSCWRAGKPLLCAIKICL